MGVDDIVSGLESKTDSTGQLDYAFLIEGSNIVTKVASIVLGILSVTILILIPVIVTGEVIYICFPFIREKIDDLLIKVEGKGVAHRVVGVTFRDAIEAVNRANTVEIGEKSALLIYLQLKLKSIWFLMFILALVLQGSGPIIQFMYRRLSGILSQF